jgi:predicted acylesterase/phospholipase RssA
VAFKILSLDGGGIRGVLAAQMLLNLQKRLGKPLNQYFDLITGTSTGSMLAAALVLGIPEQKIVDLYRMQGKIVFPYTDPLDVKRLPVMLEYGFLGPKFSERGLKTVLQDLLGEKKLADVSKSKLLITSYDTLERQPIVFKSWDSKFAQTPLWEACICSASAPTFFPAHKLEREYHGTVVNATETTVIFEQTAATDDGDYRNMEITITDGKGKHQQRIIKQYNGEKREAIINEPWQEIPDRTSTYQLYKQYCAIDGGLAANNPTACGVAAAIRLGYSLNDLHVLSIGTGDPTRQIPWEAARKWGTFQWIKGGLVIKVMTDAPSDIYDYITEQIIGDNSRYLRLQFPLDRQLTAKKLNDDIDDASEENINNLIEAADVYINLPENQKMLDHFVAKCEQDSADFSGT